MNALQMIQAERQRQIDVEGWTPEHDDEHRDGEMLSAANFYYLNATGRSLTFRDDGAPLGWRWDACWWKPKSPERDLVRAGALCMAELDRLRRIAGSFREHVAAKLRDIIAALSVVLSGKDGTNG